MPIKLQLNKQIYIYADDYKYLKSIAEGFDKPRDIIHKALSYISHNQDDYYQFCATTNVKEFKHFPE